MGRPPPLSPPRTIAHCSWGRGGGHRETEAAAAPRTVTGTTRAAAALLAPAAGPSLQAQHDAVALTEPVPVEPRV